METLCVPAPSNAGFVLTGYWAADHPRSLVQLAVALEHQVGAECDCSGWSAELAAWRRQAPEASRG